jgi:hypothetical protein
VEERTIEVDGKVSRAGWILATAKDEVEVIIRVPGFGS